MRPYLDRSFDPVSLVDSESAYGRSLWGILSLELWQREFIDRDAGENRWQRVARAVHESTANKPIDDRVEVV